MLFACSLVAHSKGATILKKYKTIPKEKNILVGNIIAYATDVVAAALSRY